MQLCSSIAAVDFEGTKIFRIRLLLHAAKNAAKRYSIIDKKALMNYVFRQTLFKTNKRNRNKMQKKSTTQKIIELMMIYIKSGINNLKESLKEEIFKFCLKFKSMALSKPLNLKRNSNNVMAFNIKFYS